MTNTDPNSMERMKATAPQFPVYEFRPLPSFFVGRVRRYAGGQWLEDDGEYDLSFIGDAKGGGFVYPCSLYVSLPYRSNIILSWLSTRWTERVNDHPNGNPWHYMLRDGAHDWGQPWGRDNHPNAIAGDAGMHKMSSERRCSHGRHIEFMLGDRHIEAGLLRERDSKEIYRFPADPVCMYCSRRWVDDGFNTVPK